jgi:hypothetical protein
MIKAPALYLDDKKNDRKRFIEQYDFHRFTEFNPDGLENLLNLSIKKYLLDEAIRKKLTKEAKKKYGVYYEKFDEVIIQNEEANKICIDKLQYLTLIKLNWNIPDRIVDDLRKILSYEFQSIFESYFFVDDFFKVDPWIFNLFIRICFADLLTIFLSNIMRRTPLGDVIAEKGYVNFDHLPFYAFICNVNFFEVESDFIQLLKGLISESVLKDKHFAMTLTYENEGVVEFINNEVYIEKYLNIFEREYNDKTYMTKIIESVEEDVSQLNIIDESELLKKNLFLQEKLQELESKIKGKTKPKPIKPKYSPNFTPDLIRKCIEIRESNNDTSTVIMDKLSTFYTEEKRCKKCSYETIRSWFRVNGKWNPKFRNLSEFQIVMIIQEEDIKPWFKNLKDDEVRYEPIFRIL